MIFEYRVVIEREGCRRRFLRFATEKAAQRRLALLGPEPWLAYGKKADDLVCCTGFECGCGAMTHREATEQKRAQMPKLLVAKIERRRVGSWETT